MMDVMAGTALPKLSPKAAKQCFQSKFDTTIGNLRTFLKTPDEDFSLLHFCLNVNEKALTTKGAKYPPFLEIKEVYFRSKNIS